MGRFHKSRNSQCDVPDSVFGLYLRHFLFFTKVGDAPEQIYYSSVDISAEDWNDWQASPPKVLLKPTKAWEGANEPILPSMRGEMSTLVNQLRDPAIFEENGELYLLYTGGGEQAIGIAKLAIE